jgi:hypothetical protein
MSALVENAWIEVEDAPYNGNPMFRQCRHPGCPVPVRWSIGAAGRRILVDPAGNDHIADCGAWSMDGDEFEWKEEEDRLFYRVAKTHQVKPRGTDDERRLRRLHVQELREQHQDLGATKFVETIVMPTFGLSRAQAFRLWSEVKDKRFGRFGFEVNAESSLTYPLGHSYVEKADKSQSPGSKNETKEGGLVKRFSADQSHIDLSNTRVEDSDNFPPLRVIEGALIHGAALQPIKKRPRETS